MPRANLELVTELATLHRRDFVPANTALLAPGNANPIIDGEWLALDGSYKAARDSGESQSPLLAPVHTERGRYDTQAVGKLNLLWLGMYEADTRVFDGTSMVLGSALTVQDVTVDALTRRGLKLEAAQAGRVVVGYCSKVAANGYMRFVHFGNFKR